MKNIIMLSGPDKTKYLKKEIVEEIKNSVINPTNMVVIPADFNNYEKNDKQFNGDDKVIGVVKNFKKIFKDLNIELLDNRINKKEGSKLLIEADIIYLLGGNPFKQLESLKEKKYSEIIYKSSALIIGVSAGSMNLAKHAYYSKDDDYPESVLYDGLGLTDITIDPHFDINNKDQVEEIKKHSNKQKIIGLPNESSIIINGNKVRFLGNVYIYENGKMINLQ